MKQLKRLFKTKNRLLLVFLSLVTGYFFLRLYSLMSFPIFNDEAIYIRWSQLAKYNTSLRFISLTDGKQPLFVWITMMLVPYFRDPLLAGRLVSVFSGLLTMLGLGLISQKLFRKTSLSMLTMFLYAFYPLAVITDRMALFDSFLSAFSVWSFYLAIVLAQKLQISNLFLLAHALAAAALTKTSGFFNFYLLPTTVFVLDKPKKQFWRWLLLLAGAILLANLYYSILRLSPDFGLIAKKNEIFVYQISELTIQTVWRNFSHNFLLTGRWILAYLGFLPLLLVVCSFLLNKNHFKEKLLLFCWFLIPFLVTITLGKILYSRYLFFLTLPLLPLMAFSVINIIKNRFLPRFVQIIILILVFSYPFYFSLTAILNPNSAPFPLEDRFQYLEGWPAGGGVKEAVNFFLDEAKNKKIIVVSEEKYGSLVQTSLEIYLSDNKNITLYPLDSLTDKIPGELLTKSITHQIYLVTNKIQTTPSWPVKLIKEYQKDKGNYFLRVYKLPL